MEHYWSLNAISKRLGYKSPQAVMTAFRLRGLLMYLRKAPRGRWVWYSNSELIQAWEISMSQRDREIVLKHGKRKGMEPWKQHDPLNHRGNGSGPEASVSAPTDQTTPAAREQPEEQPDGSIEADPTQG